MENLCEASINKLVSRLQLAFISVHVLLNIHCFTHMCVILLNLFDWYCTTLRSAFLQAGAQCLDLILRGANHKQSCPVAPVEYFNSN